MIPQYFKKSYNNHPRGMSMEFGTCPLSMGWGKAQDTRRHTRQILAHQRHTKYDCWCQKLDLQVDSRKEPRKRIRKQKHTFPTHLEIQGQWWSNCSTHRLHDEQCLDRNGLTICFEWQNTGLGLHYTESLSWTHVHINLNSWLFNSSLLSVSLIWYDIFVMFVSILF